ncbi:hypothetical protein [Paenibacillus sp. FSL H3-0286]|uniref:hypothetical protein n=1 Tax=Paenibacillus sp. FSL H3-0286 TaxID=2921427 RepID=UPI00324835E2
MFEVFVKDFVNGTEVETITPDRYMNIIMYWGYGYDIVINEKTIINKNIESVYSRKVDKN